jgi:hypothetical protein
MMLLVFLTERTCDIGLTTWDLRHLRHGLATCDLRHTNCGYHNATMAKPRESIEFSA